MRPDTNVLELFKPMQDELRRLPSVDKLLLDERVRRLGETFPRQVVVDLVRQRLEEERALVLNGRPCVPADDVVNSIVARAQNLAHPGPHRVINATGVLLHTNLGRAPISQEAIDAMCDEFVKLSNSRAGRSTTIRNA